MEFLLIGDSKLKIVMSDEDMRTFRLDGTGDYSSPGYRRAFWQVLELAGREVGFQTGGDKLLIQFYPLKTGGCEVFVTKLGLLSKESARLVSDSERVTMLSHRKSFYAFDSLADLKRFAASISKALTAPYPITELYASERGGYYLAVEEYAKGGETVEFPQILEFSRQLTADLGFFITEHLTPVSKGDAITGVLDM